MVEQLSGKSPMGSGDQRVFYVSAEKGLLNADVERKNPGASVHSKIVYLFLFALVSCLMFKVVFYSCEKQEARLQESIDHLQNKVANLEQIVMSDLQEAPLVHEDDSTSPNRTTLLKRIRRSSKRGGRGGSRGLSCHLEGKPGPNILSRRPMQKPRHPTECILWQIPIREPAVECRLATKQDEDQLGIEYIRITRPGSYYVYSQLTYKARIWAVSGHRVVLSRGDEDVTLMQVTTPIKDVQPDLGQTKVLESRYTGGVFYLQLGDLLAVYPVRGSDEFATSREQSFFGVFMIKAF